VFTSEVANVPASEHNASLDSDKQIPFNISEPAAVLHGQLTEFSDIALSLKLYKFVTDQLF